MRIIFLGTAGSVPTVERSLPAVVVKRQNEQLMFDCGEGTQRQMIRAKVGFHKKMKIFISHMHGDHVLGLPGLLQTMALMDRKRKIEVYGPVGIKNFFECIRDTLQFGLTFPVEVHEIYASGIVCREDTYIVEAVESNHVVQSLAYSFVEKPRPGKFYPEKARTLGVAEGELWSKLQQGESIHLADDREVAPSDVMGPQRKGRKIVYTGDTRPFKGLKKFAFGADVLIHDSTFDDALIEKADLDGHSTPLEAAKEAKNAKVKQLVLIHISARYPDPEVLLSSAQRVFQNTLVARDFMELELPPSSN